MRLLFLCPLLVACGFEAGVPESREPGETRPDAARPVRPDAAPPPIDAAQLTSHLFIERLVTVECQHAFTCRAQYPSSPESFAVIWGTDLTNCVATDRNYLARETIASAILSGTITFDPVSAATCLAAPGFPTSCQALFSGYNWSPTCLATLLGHVPDGGSCVTEWQCAIGSVCRQGRCSS